MFAIKNCKIQRRDIHKTPKHTSISVLCVKICHVLAIYYRKNHFPVLSSQWWLSSGGVEERENRAMHLVFHMPLEDI